LTRSQDGIHRMDIQDGFTGRRGYCAVGVVFRLGIWGHSEGVLWGVLGAYRIFHTCKISDKGFLFTHCSMLQYMSEVSHQCSAEVKVWVDAVTTFPMCYRLVCEP
jgi:hypothetical protein